MERYRIHPVPVPDRPYFADAVFVDDEGAWLAEFDLDDRTLLAYNDRAGGAVPAPPNWRDLIVEAIE